LGRHAKNRGVFLGFVEAPDQKAAELMAAKAFMLSEWQRKRLPRIGSYRWGRTRSAL
jgi:hypothetical protein